MGGGRKAEGVGARRGWEAVKGGTGWSDRGAVMIRPPILRPLLSFCATSPVPCNRFTTRVVVVDKKERKFILLKFIKLKQKTF